MPDRLRAYRTLRYIDARTVRELSEVVFEDVCLSPIEAKAILNLAQAVPEGDPSWHRLKTEAAAVEADQPRVAAAR